MITYLRTSKGYEPQTIVTLSFCSNLVALLGVFRVSFGLTEPCVAPAQTESQIKVAIEILGCFAAQEAV